MNTYQVSNFWLTFLIVFAFIGVVATATVSAVAVWEVFKRRIMGSTPGHWPRRASGGAIPGRFPSGDSVAVWLSDDYPETPRRRPGGVAPVARDYWKPPPHRNRPPGGAGERKAP